MSFGHATPPPTQRSSQAPLVFQVEVAPSSIRGGSAGATSREKRVRAGKDGHLPGALMPAFFLVPWLVVLAPLHVCMRVAQHTTPHPYCPASHCRGSCPCTHSNARSTPPLTATLYTTTYTLHTATSTVHRHLGWWQALHRIYHP